MAQKQNKIKKDIRNNVFETLKHWNINNKDGFDVSFVQNKDKTAKIMLEIVYYYWHNYKNLIAPIKGTKK